MTTISIRDRDIALTYKPSKLWRTCQVGKMATEQGKRQVYDKLFSYRQVIAKRDGWDKWALATSVVAKQIFTGDNLAAELKKIASIVEEMERTRETTARAFGLFILQRGDYGRVIA